MSGTHPARAAASPASSPQLRQTKARAASATKKLDGIAHWLADKAKSWGIDITAWYACTGSHRQSEMAAMGPIVPAYTSPGWQNLQNMLSTVACALLVASSTYQLPSAPTGAGVRARALGKLAERCEVVLFQSDEGEDAQA